MGTLGFSYIGLLYLLMLFIPNILLAKNKPQGYTLIAPQENRFLLISERIGQVLVTVSVLIFTNYNPTVFSAWSSWLIVSVVLMVLYEIAWIRYFSKPTLENFYRPFLLVPVPLASLPVLAFLLLGVYGKVICLIISALILAIGHIGIHVQHYKILSREETG